MNLRLPGNVLRYSYYIAACGVLELLHLVAIRTPTLASLLLPLAYLGGLFLLSKLVWARHGAQETSYASIGHQQRDYFLRELSIYLFVVLVMIVVAREAFKIPLVDLLYDTLFVMVLGHFAAVENTLAKSCDWYRQGIQQQIETFRLIPISTTLRRVIYTILGAILIFMSAAIFRLYSALNGPSHHTAAIVSFIAENLFFFLMLGYLMQRVARAYTTNMHYIMETQLKAVRDAQAGDYSQTIPLLAQNELGLMGMQINRLIEYIHKREDLENLLKRVVSPDIMEKLLTTDTDQLKRGEEREVAILFCDIRGFTEMSEGASAADVIFFLNSFFSELTEVVTRNNGTINKFMGDAILAVYGSDNPNEAVDYAVNTANEIAMRVRQMRLPNGACPETGTGIHFGRVVAGTIGSDQRYEYTFLGDAVNTASRLQGLSKRLGYSIIVSAEAYEHLSDYLKYGLMDLGLHHVRGKSEPIQIYGGPADDEHK